MYLLLLNAEHLSFDCGIYYSFRNLVQLLYFALCFIEHFINSMNDESKMRFYKVYTCMHCTWMLEAHTVKLINTLISNDNLLERL